MSPTKEQCQRWWDTEEPFAQEWMLKEEIQHPNNRSILLPGDLTYKEFFALIDKKGEHTA